MAPRTVVVVVVTAYGTTSAVKSWSDVVAGSSRRKLSGSISVLEQTRTTVVGPLDAVGLAGPDASGVEDPFDSSQHAFDVVGCDAEPHEQRPHRRALGHTADNQLAVGRQLDVGPRGGSVRRRVRHATAGRTKQRRGQQPESDAGRSHRA